MKKIISSLALLGLAGVAYKFRSEIMNEVNMMKSKMDAPHADKPKAVTKNNAPAPTFMTAGNAPQNQNAPAPMPAKKSA